MCNSERGFLLAESDLSWGVCLLIRRTGQRVWPGDEAGRAVAGEVVPAPLEEHHQAAFIFDDIDEMDEEPGEPSEVAGEFEPAQIGDSTRSANRRQVAMILVDER